MRKFPLSAVLMLIPAFALVFRGLPWLPRWTQGHGRPVQGGRQETADVEKGKVAGLAAGDGKITGTVKFKGEAPKMPLEARIAAHKDAEICMMGKGFEKNEQMWIVDDKGGVANVVISLAAPAGKKFDKLKDDSAFKKGVELDQPHCAYVPHVVAAPR